MKTECPKCGAGQLDLDGVGFVACDRPECGYCSHPARTDGVCDVCGDGVPNLATVEREHIGRVLRATGGNKSRAAKLLGISLKTLYNRLNAYSEAAAAQQVKGGAS